MNNAIAENNFISTLFGKPLLRLNNIGDKVRYIIIYIVCVVTIIHMLVLGILHHNTPEPRTLLNSIIGVLALTFLIFQRSNASLKVLNIIMATCIGVFFLYLLYKGNRGHWSSIWIFLYPLVAIYLCHIKVGLIESLIVFLGTTIILSFSLTQFPLGGWINLRVVVVYAFVLVFSVISEYINILNERKEVALNAEIAREKEMVQTMQDNIHQGIFMMDKDCKILPQYSRPFISILSHYDSEPAGKSFLDILSSSLDAAQIETMKSYFSMIFEKTKSQKILESANPISDFEYKIGNKHKILRTRFNLIEDEIRAPVIVGVIEDITREMEFENELKIQKELQQQEMKNMFDVIQVDPLVFQDFIDDAESNFNYINNTLKDRTLSEKQVVIKFFQNIHAIKSNALILGLESFGKKLHDFEDEIKAVSAMAEINNGDVLSLAIKLEQLMQEKDNYLALIQKIETFKTKNQVDTVLLNSLTKAVAKVAAETDKEVEIKAGQVDMNILESKLRKPIKDILFQCVRNSIYHGIEPVEERIYKNKKSQGLLVFSITSDDGKAEITFSDDGRGLDLEKIRNKYLEKNPGASPDNKVLLAAIFAPEFSTLEEVSMSAGRGVGLSLVKDIVKEHGGSIRVTSDDSGATFRFTFPIPA